MNFDWPDASRGWRTGDRFIHFRLVESEPRFGGGAHARTGAGFLHPFDGRCERRCHLLKR